MEYKLLNNQEGTYVVDMQDSVLPELQLMKKYALGLGKNLEEAKDSLSLCKRKHIFL